MRRYVTTFVWYEDRLESLSSRWLVLIASVAVAGLGCMAALTQEFLDNLTFLLPESDIRTAAVLTLGLLMVTSAALWLLSCCLGALGRRLLLRLRGL